MPVDGGAALPGWSPPSATSVVRMGRCGGWPRCPLTEVRPFPGGHRRRGHQSSVRGGVVVGRGAR